MRYLFLAVLAVNALLLGWRLASRGEDTGAAGPPSDRGRVRLLAESQGDTPGGDPPPSRTATHCYTLEPLTDPERTARLKASLERAGLKVEVREQEHLEPLGWWVFMPPADSLEAAQAVGQELAQRGVSDFVFVVGAEKANAISLGLFSDHATAVARVTELRALGFSPQIEQRYSKRVVQAIEVRTPKPPPDDPEGATWRAVDCQGTVD